MIADEIYNLDSIEKDDWGYSFTCESTTKTIWDMYKHAVQTKNFDVPFANVLTNAQKLCEFVEMNPDILRGTPRIKGTRIPVHRVLNAIEEYGGIKDAKDVYPSLELIMIQDALRFAATVLESPIEYDDPDSD